MATLGIGTSSSLCACVVKVATQRGNNRPTVYALGSLEGDKEVSDIQLHPGPLSLAKSKRIGARIVQRVMPATVLTEVRF